MIFNKFTGKSGEQIAVKHLKSKGYKILDTNYRSRHGEIDIVCMHKGMLVFVEVKSRKNLSFGLPREAVTYRKQQSIIYTAQYYIFRNALVDIPVRFDVIEVVDDKISSHIENAFQLN